MACSCRATALRLFVRSFAHLNIAESSPTSTALRQKVRPQAGVHPICTHRNLHTSKSCREAATAARASSDTSSAPLSARDGRKPEQYSEKKGITGEQRTTAYSAVAELTPEAIDALASEISSDASPRSVRPTELDSLEPDSDEPHWRETQDGVGGGGRRRDKRATNNKASRKTRQKEAEIPKPRPVKREHWAAHKKALKAKLGGESWNPRKRLSPDALEGIRALHDEFPEVFTTQVLAAKFEISPEAVRRILKSRWEPKAEEEEEREERWFKRGKKIWERNAELGMKPPKRWREIGIKKRRRRPFLDDNVNRLVSPYRGRGVSRRKTDEDEEEEAGF